MKRLFLFLLIGFLLINNVSAWSYDNSYSYGEALAYVEIVGTYPMCDGQKYNNYCVGDYYVDDLGAYYVDES